MFVPLQTLGAELSGTHLQHQPSPTFEKLIKSYRQCSPLCYAITTRWPVLLPD